MIARVRIEDVEGFTLAVLDNGSTGWVWRCVVQECSSMTTNTAQGWRDLSEAMYHVADHLHTAHGLAREVPPVTASFFEP